MKKLHIAGTVLVIVTAVLAAIWLPLKRFLDGDLQETVVVMEKKTAVGSDAPVRIIVRHRKYDLPIEESDVNLSLRSEEGNLIPIGNYKTNDCGTINEKIKLADLSPGKYSVELNVKSFLGKDRLNCPFKIYQPKELVLSTSKPLYRPGETVRIRSFLRNPQTGKPIKGEEVKYEVIDPKSNIIFRKKTCTSEFGLSAVNCPLSTVLNHGRYIVKISTEGAESQKNVDIKNYTLPKFKVNFISQDKFFIPHKKIIGKLYTEYYFGEKVGNASFEIKTAGFYEGGATPVEIGKQILQEGFTDKKGFAKVAFYPPEACEERSGLLVFEIIVTDQAGNKVTQKKSVSISDRKIELTVLPEAGVLVPGLKNKVYFIATRSDGKPVKCNIKLGDKKGITDKDGMAMLSFIPRRISKNVTAQAYLPGWKSDTKILEIPHKSILPAIIRTNKAIYKNEKTATVSIKASEKLDYIFLDVMASGGLKQQLSFNLKGKLYTRVTVPLEGLRGEVKITGYIVDERGNHKACSTYFFVKSQTGLVLDVTKNKEIYKPGDDVKLGISLKDKRGLPVRGAVSINIADEKLLSFAGGNFDFFNEALLNNDTAGISYLDSSPDGSEQIKARILLLKKALLKPQYKNVMQMLVEEGLINDDVVNRAREFMEGRNDFSYLNPELQDIAEKLKGEVSPVSTFTTKAWKERAAARKWADLKGIIGTLFTIACIVVVVGFIIVKLGGRVIQWLVILAVIAVLGAMLLPALSMARESARKVSFASNLKQIMLSMRMAEESGYDLDKYEVDTSKPKGKKVKVRNYFPETLYWNPEAVTDENGNLDIQFPMANSMTSWRGIFDSVDNRGALASKSIPLKTFQEFFVEIDSPNEMSLYDEISVPVTCHNYLKQKQRVKLTLTASDGLSLKNTEPTIVYIESEGVKTVFVPVSARTLGVKKLKVVATGSQYSDAMESEIRILPSGNRIQKTEQGILSSESVFSFELPDNAIPGSGQVVFKTYPNTLSEATEGLASMFRQPYGCFEQTSSTTYPNVMILRYLKGQNQSSPELARRAKNYIHKGYQRLLTFEVDGGGFSLYGKSPANIHLTAYGILEFTDMSKLIYVDPEIINRAKKFLFSEQSSEGSWKNNTVETAYTAWALAESGDKSSELRTALEYLYKKYNDGSLSNYTKALTAIAMLKLNSRDSRGNKIARDLVNSAIIQGNQAYWTSGGYTANYSRGRCQDTVATALCTVALQAADINPILRHRALKSITTSKFPNGGWGSTESTLAAIRALLNDKPVCNLDRDSEMSIACNGKRVKTFSVKKENSDTVKILDLSSYLELGSNSISMEINKGSQFPFIISGSYWIADKAQEQMDKGLSISLEPYRTSLKVGDELYCKLSAENKSRKTVHNPIIKIGIPAGFSPDIKKFKEMENLGKIEKYEISGGEIVLYLDRIESGHVLKFEYMLKARLEGKITMPKAEVYEYYNPDNRALSKQEKITVNK